MKWLPYHRFEITSRLSADEAAKAIAAHIESRWRFRIVWPSRANNTRFVGELEGNTFNIHRLTGYRNSFQPAVHGEIEQQARGSRITVTMRPFIMVFAFVALWLVFMFTTFAAPNLITSDLLMAGIVYLMIMAGFWFEAVNQEVTLRQIFREIK